MSQYAFRSNFMQQFVTKARATTANATAAATTASSTLNTSTTIGIGGRGASSKVPRPSHHHFHTTSKGTQATGLGVTSGKAGNSAGATATVQDRQRMPSSPSRNNHKFHFSEPPLPKSSTPVHKQQRHLSDCINSSDNNGDNSVNSERFQSILKTRRTTSNFKPVIDDYQQQLEIKDSIYRAVECAVQAPNHYRTEPTTYYQITPRTKSWEQLLNITYNVVFNKTKKSDESEEEITTRRMKAESKRNKWRDTIGGYIVVCVGGQPDQMTNNKNSSDEDIYKILPFRPPETERQMEDYATACASIQNILLSLHSEGLGAKWATGSIPRCKAMRELVGCQNDELIAGLVMIGIPKAPEPKDWRRRRAFVGNVFKDLS